MEAFGGQIEALDDHTRLAQAVARAPFHRGQLLADHDPRQGRRGLCSGVAFGDHPAGSEDRGAVAERLYLGQFVTDVEDRTALGRDLAQGLEQALDLLGGEYRGRLVHDQKLGVLQQTAGDFDALALADRQAVDAAIGVERQAVFGGDSPHPLGQRRHVAGPVPAEGDVFVDGHRLEQGEMLKHHADAELARGARVIDCDAFPVPQNVAGIRVQHAIDHLDQGALAGAVLAQQGVNLAGLHGKVHMVVGEHAGEPLGRAAHFDPRGHDP